MIINFKDNHTDIYLYTIVGILISLLNIYILSDQVAVVFLINIISIRNSDAIQ